jgi:hypothetical protein
MNIEEIKKEALRMMLAVGREIDGVPISSLEGSAASGRYLAAMTGAIGRCLADLERRHALKPILWEVETDAWVHTAALSRLPLFSREDLYAVLSVSLESAEGGYVGDQAFSVEGEELVLPRLSGGACVRVIYAPRAPRVERHDNAMELSCLHETVAALIPYFIKGELFREEDPAEAGEARNFYESGVEDYLARTAVGGVLGGGRVHTVYSQVAL